MVYAKPRFQNQLRGKFRQLPDISMNADPQTGVEIIVTPDSVPGDPVSVAVFGGTSLSCPMFSALWSIANQAAGGGPLGQAAPTLYDLPDDAITDVNLHFHDTLFNVSGVIINPPSTIAHENALQRLSDAKVPSKGLPMETYYGSVMKLSHFFNGEAVELFHIPSAVTDGDSIVYFRSSDVIAAGDIFNMNSFPFIDLQRGGSVQGVLAGLNRMLEIVVPEFRSEGGTMVIPGHGRICDTADLGYYHIVDSCGRRRARQRCDELALTA